MCLSLYQNSKKVPANLLLQAASGTVEASERMCAGVDPDGTDMPLENWIRNWSNPVFGGIKSCTQLFTDIIYTNPNNNLRTFNPENYERIKGNVEYMLSKYFVNGRNLLLPGQNGWNNFQNTLVNICSDIPGVCTRAQESLCGGCTRAQIANNPDLLRLCGCHAPVLDPKIFTRNVAPQCDPLCNQSTSARLTNPQTGNVLQCNDTVCVIDNVSITATKSSGSNVSISQICPGCNAETGCTCIVDTSITNMSSSLGLDNPFVFQQYCPPEFSTCIVINSNEGTSDVVPCGNYFTGASENVYNTDIPIIVIIIGILVIMIVIVSLFAYIYSYNTYYGAIQNLSVKYQNLSYS